jgi:hypothetical protein
MQVTDKIGRFGQLLIFALARGGAMRSSAGGCSTYIALTLAAIAAIMSEPGRAADTYQDLQSLLSIAAPEAGAMAGAIGSKPDSLLLP